MNTEEAKKLVKETFQEIGQTSFSKDNFEKIIEKPILQKHRMKLDKYPKINPDFKISSEDLNNYINNDGTFVEDIQEKIKNNPIAKLLYALAWKQGDLQKIKHIVRGIKSKNESEASTDNEEATVFFHFGRYLSDKNEPIVDQHVIRAYMVFENMKQPNEGIDLIRKQSSLQKKHNESINSYKIWLNTLNKKSSEELYYIDQILFALGKAIKL